MKIKHLVCQQCGQEEKIEVYSHEEAEHRRIHLVPPPAVLGAASSTSPSMNDRSEIMRPRVFVSSVMEGFAIYRQAVREGIIAAGGDPVLVEDFPSLPTSPRTSCLDGVGSSDIYIGIVGNRGGWTAPSGKPVVEEEFEEARRCKLRTLAFVQNVERDEGAARLVQLFSDYIGGMFRQQFSSADDLRSAVEKALAPLMEHYTRSETDYRMIEERFKNTHKIQYHTMLRVALIPERQGELIDPVALESPEVKARK